MTTADRHAADGAVDGARAAAFQWVQPLDEQVALTPAPRSGHAMTLLAATASVLVFGGSNGQVFFDDFHLLEPTQYAEADARKTPRKNVNGGALPSRLDGTREDDATLPLSVAWKKLVVSRAPSTAQYSNPNFLSSSFGASTDSPRGGPIEEDEHLGGGRDYHTMHYVPSAADEEKRLGFRVLVVGNAIVSADNNDDENNVGDGGVSQPLRSFDMAEMRVDEVRVKQPLLEAQWVPRKIQSMYKPHARNGHCSALLGDQLFCFGGKNAMLTGFYNDFFYFDTALNQWREPTTTGSLPPPRAFAAMAVSTSSEQLFLYGGHDDKQQFGGMYMYDIRLSRWDKVMARGEKPATRINHTLTFMEPHHLMLFGGRQRTSRRNDAFVYDLKTRVWKQLGGKPLHAGSRPGESNFAESQSQSQQTLGASQSRALLSPASTALRKTFPRGRTAHCSVLYSHATTSTLRESHQIIVFGGYAGSHTWLNDTHVLDVNPKKIFQPIEFVRHVPQVFSSTSSTSSRELVTTRGPSPTSNPSGSSQSHSSGSSQSHPRSSSRSSNEFVLTDITNIAQAAHDDKVAFATSTESTTTAIATVGTPTSSYTPAAVAARRRKLAEMELSRAEMSSSAQKKRRRVDPTNRTTSSQSQSQIDKGGGLESKATVLPASQSRMDSVSGSETIGLQTTMIQLLQRQQRMEESLTRLSSAVRNDQGSRQREAIASHQIFLQKQNEQLEIKLDTMTRRYDTMFAKAQALEDDKRTLQERLVAAETEIYLHKKTIDEIVPRLGSEVLSAVEAATRLQANSTQLIESKISSIHDLLDEVRHASGERTETDESPQKRDSIFPDDCTPSQPTVFYPQTVVRDLESKLYDAVQENRALHDRVAVLEDKLKKASRKDQLVRELSLAYLQYEEGDEETKASE